MTELFALANAAMNAFNGHGYVLNKDGEYVTHMLVPGIKPADLDIEYRDGGIAIRGATPANDDDPTAFRNAIERFIGQGVSVVITDRPDLAKELLGR